MTKELAPIPHALWRPPKRSPASALHMVWRRRVVVLVSSLLFAAIGVAVVRSLPAEYRAEAVILVESQRIPERFVAPTVSSELKDRLATLSQQILSYSKLLEIVEKFDLYKPERANHTQEEIVEMMRADVNVQLEQGWSARSRSENRPSAFRISYQGSSPEVVALVANQLGGLFIDENLKSREVQAVGTSEFLGTQLAESKKRLEEQEGRLSAYKLRFNGELPEQENMLLATLGQLHIRLQAANDAATRAEQTKTIIEASVAAAEETEQTFTDLLEQGSEAAANHAGPQEGEDATAGTLRRRINIAKNTWGENHPEMMAMRDALARLEKDERPGATQTDNATAAASPKNHTSTRDLQLAAAKAQRQERLNSMRSQAALAKTQIETANSERERITKEIAKVQQRLSHIPVREQEMAVVKRDYEISRAHYQSLLDKGMSADLAAQMELRQKAERFTVIDAARVPQKPVKPNRPILYAVATLLSCALGIAIGFGSEMRRNALLGEWDVPKGVRVLGRIPSIVTYNPVFDIAPRPRRGRRMLVVVCVLLVALAGAVIAAWQVGLSFKDVIARLHG